MAWEYEMPKGRKPAPAPAPKKAPAPRRRSMTEDFIRALHRTGGNIVGSAADIGGLIANPLNALINATGIPKRLTGEELGTDLGGAARRVVRMPKPETELEKYVDMAASGVASGAPVVSVARQVAKRAASPVAKKVAELVDTPLAEALGGAGANVAGQAAADAGAGPIVQTLVSLGGGAGGGLVGAAPDIVRAVKAKRVKADDGFEYEVPVAKTEDTPEVDTLDDPDAIEALADLIQSTPVAKDGPQASPTEAFPETVNDNAPPKTMTELAQIAEDSKAAREARPANDDAPKASDAEVHQMTYEALKKDPMVSDEFAENYAIEKGLKAPVQAVNDDLPLPLDPEAPAGGGEVPPAPPKPPEPPEGGGPSDPVDPDVITRLTAAITNAGKLSKEQAAALSQSRSEKLKGVVGAREMSSGEAGLRTELKQLEGEAPKVDYEGVREEFTQEEIDGLFDMIKNFPGMSLFDSINARKGLVKLFDGSVPQPKEIDLLSNIFPPEFIKAALKHRSMKTKIMTLLGNALNLPRSLMSSFDLSAPLRQGIFLVGRKQFYTAFASMFKQLGSERAFKGVMDEIEARETYPLMEESGLSLSKLGRDLSDREEAFMSQWAEKIPVIGRGVRASERAFSGFLNKLRADVFDDLVRQARDLGIDLTTDAKTLKDIASFVNSATGRASLGRLNTSAPLLNGLFFSPRLIASRVNMLNPIYYGSLSPVVRNQAIKDLMKFGGIALTILSLFKAGGAEVESDTRSSDFGKIKDGNTRYDILGGFGQYVVLGARLITNETKTMNGEVRPLGKKFGDKNRLEVAATFLSNKASPVAGYVRDFLKGSDPVGKEFDAGRDAVELFIPLFVQDVMKAYEEGGVAAAGTSLPGMFGVGVYRAEDGLTSLPASKDDPVVVELGRLSKSVVTGDEYPKDLIGFPGKSLNVGDERRTLTDDEYKEYLKVSGGYILESVREFIASEEYKTMTDDERIEEIREIKNEMREIAREELFSEVEEDGFEYEAPSNETATAEGGWEYGGTPGAPVASAKSIVESVFPMAEVTQEARDPKSSLGRKNPGSWHNKSRAAVDVRPIKGLSFAGFVAGIEEAGYKIIEARDEVSNPSKHATAPHWHLVIGEA